MTNPQPQSPERKKHKHCFIYSLPTWVIVMVTGRDLYSGGFTKVCKCGKVKP